MFVEDADVRASRGVPALLAGCGNDGLVEGSAEPAVLTKIDGAPADGAVDCELLEVGSRLLLL